MNNAIIIKLVAGQGKNNKNYYALKITHNYDSGNHYTEMLFLNEKEYTQLKVVYKDSIIIGE